MGNVTSTSSRARVRRNDRANLEAQAENRTFQYMGSPKLPHEVQLNIASFLCPHCAGADLFLPTEEARMLQRSLGNLAGTSRYLLTVANEHRFHSFVLPRRRGLLTTTLNDEETINQAALLQSQTVPELIERLIQYQRLSQELRYLSIRDFTLTYKAGITKRRLRLFMDASSRYGIPVPSFVPELLQHPSTTIEGYQYWFDEELWLASLNARKFDAWLIRLLLFGLAPRLEKLLIDPTIAEEVFCGPFLLESPLPSVVSLFVPESRTDARGGGAAPRYRTNLLLLKFPNLRHFQNHDPALILFPVHEDPGRPPSLFPNIRKLTVAARQAGRLLHVTQILWAFPQLEELVYHRSPSQTGSVLVSQGGPDFSNANLFDGVHHSLRKLTYSSTMVRPHWGMASTGAFYEIRVNCYEQRRFSDVPHFGAFQVLEHLTIDQALLGRLSPMIEYHEPRIGPRFPELSWNLPQSLRHLYIRFVYDRDQLAAQLISVARAKAKEGQFPHLSDIYITCVEGGTRVYDEDWPPHIPLLPTDDVLKLLGEIMIEAGVCLWSVAAKIAPPPGEADQYPRGVIRAGIPIKFSVTREFFREL